MTEAPWRVIFAPQAERELQRLPADASARLAAPIAAPADERRPHSSLKISGTDFWRIRVGDHRVVYAIDESGRAVVILRVARRAESTYRRLGG